MPKINKDIGIRLLQYRKKKDLKAIDLAKILKISQGSLSDIENAKTLPSFETLFKLIQNTDINIYWLFTGKDPMLLSKKFLDEGLEVHEMKVFKPFDISKIPEKGEMYVLHPENLIPGKTFSSLSKEIPFNDVKQLFDKTWDQVNNDQRGWLKIELYNLLRRLFELIKQK